ncbi:unnamed protein product [Somion occarium]|uniref:Uncharacterized protein n=1 Tax=Somion occarium TaxID=3059160 RepID=A0ABP1D3F1_9APHY
MLPKLPLELEGLICQCALDIGLQERQNEEELSLGKKKAAGGLLPCMPRLTNPFSPGVLRVCGHWDRGPSEETPSITLVLGTVISYKSFQTHIPQPVMLGSVTNPSGFHCVPQAFAICVLTLIVEVAITYNLAIDQTGACFSKAFISHSRWNHIHETCITLYGQEFPEVVSSLHHHL